MMKTITLGDVKRFPVIKSIAGILGESGKRSQEKFVASTMNEYYRLMNYGLNSLEKENRIYLMNLVKLDFINRMDDSHLPALLKNHMKCLIIGVHNDKVRNMNFHKKQFKRK